MQWVASTLHTTSEHGVSNITTADAAHLGCQQSTELTPPPPGRFKWTHPFHAKDEIWFLRMCHHISNSLYHPPCKHWHSALAHYSCKKQSMFSVRIYPQNCLLPLSTFHKSPALPETRPPNPTPPCRRSGMTTCYVVCQLMLYNLLLVAGRSLVG